jgi:hypothetical protein
MVPRTLRGLSTLLAMAKFSCRVVRDFGPIVREYVPEASLAQYDAALSAINSACALILSINWVGDGVG